MVTARLIGLDGELVDELVTAGMPAVICMPIPVQTNFTPTDDPTWPTMRIAEYHLEFHVGDIATYRRHLP